MGDFSRKLGQASFLARSLRCTVLPFVFTPQSKSKLGWDFLAICDTGRFKDHHSAQGSDEYTHFWNQLQYVEHEAQAETISGIIRPFLLEDQRDQAQEYRRERAMIVLPRGSTN